ncbi:MAG: hypothetical protein FJ044_03495 [Candidatus Cloacimonetes bacterium]|nr:hypothetical protein [Candidatus Cloacimonadota bacterium]
MQWRELHRLYQENREAALTIIRSAGQSVKFAAEKLTNGKMNLPNSKNAKNVDGLEEKQKRISKNCRKCGTITNKEWLEENDGLCPFCVMDMYEARRGA